MSFYVLDENNNKVEAFDKVGVLAAIEQAIANGSLAGLTADAAFISKVKCCVSGETYKIAFVTAAYYNSLVAAGTVEKNTYYYIIDDTTGEDIDEQLKNFNDAINSINDKIAALTPNQFKAKTYTIDTVSTHQIFIAPSTKQMLGTAGTGKVTALLETYDGANLVGSTQYYIYAPTFLSITAVKNVSTNAKTIHLIKGGAYAELVDEAKYASLTSPAPTTSSEIVCKVTFSSAEPFKIYEF